MIKIILSTNQNTSNFFSSLIGDLLVHNTVLNSHSNNNYVDAFWNLQNNSLIPWMISNKESRSIFRQFFAAIMNHHRFSTVTSFSIGDYALSTILNQISPDTEIFKLSNRKKRVYKRLILACKRNGGIYNEIETILKTFSQHSKSLSNLINKSPINISNEIYFDQPTSELSTDIESNLILSKEELEKIFLNDFNKSISTIFRYFDYYPIKITSNLIYYRGTLHSGKEVDIIIHPYHRKRLMNIELIPLKILKFFFTLIPFMKPLKYSLDYIIHRISTDLNNELKIRSKINNLNLPFEISKPFNQLCSKNILITNQLPYKISNKYNKNITENISKTISLSLMNNFLIPDLSLNNINIFNNQFSLTNLSSTVFLSKEETDLICYTIASLATNSLKIKEKTLKKLLINENSLLNSNWSLIPIVGKNSFSLFAAAETFSNLLNHSRRSNCNKLVFEPIAKTISFKIGENIDNEIMDFFYNKINNQFE